MCPLLGVLRVSAVHIGLKTDGITFHSHSCPISNESDRPFLPLSSNRLNIMETLCIYMWVLPSKTNFRVYWAHFRHSATTVLRIGLSFLLVVRLFSEELTDRLVLNKSSFQQCPTEGEWSKFSTTCHSQFYSQKLITASPGYAAFLPVKLLSVKSSNDMDFVDSAKKLNLWVTKIIPKRDFRAKEDHPSRMKDRLPEKIDLNFGAVLHNVSWTGLMFTSQFFL